MNKSIHFFGQSVFGQLISLLYSRLVSKVLKSRGADRYTEKFSTSDHLISMLFSTFAHCSSLPEVSGAMLGLKGKMEHFQLRHIPHKSTLADANRRRSHLVFEDIYYALLKKYQLILSDSPKQYSWEDRLQIIDFSTISVFNDILTCAGRNPSNGKRKGGIKVHT